MRLRRTSIHWTLDYDGTFSVSGDATILAVGSSGMAQAPSTSSSLSFIMANFSSSQAANSVLTIKDASGVTIATYTIPKVYTSVVYSSASVVKGSSYTVSTASSSVSAVAGTASSGSMNQGGGNRRP